MPSSLTTRSGTPSAGRAEVDPSNASIAARRAGSVVRPMRGPRDGDPLPERRTCVCRTGRSAPRRWSRLRDGRPVRSVSWLERLDGMRSSGGRAGAPGRGPRMRRAVSQEARVPDHSLDVPCPDTGHRDGPAAFTARPWLSSIIPGGRATRRIRRMRRPSRPPGQHQVNRRAPPSTIRTGTPQSC
jgi:hypothetical protein